MRSVGIKVIQIFAYAALLLGPAVAFPQSSGIPLPARSINAFTEGDGSREPLICGIEFNGMTRDLRTLGGSLGYVLNVPRKTFFGIAKVARGNVVKGAAIGQPIADATIRLGGDVLTDGWNAQLGENNAVLMVTNDVTALTRTFVLIVAGAELIVKFKFQGSEEAYNLGSIDQPTFEQFMVCEREILNQMGAMVK